MLAKKLLSLVICSSEMESLLNLSSNITSTLNSVFFIIYFLSSRQVDDYKSFPIPMLLPYHLFLSTIDVSKVFSYSSVITLIQSLNFVNRIFNFQMYSFVIKRAKDVNKPVLLEMIIPAFGFNIDNVLELIVEAELINF